MADYVGNGMSLSRARRALDENTLGYFQHLDDTDLFFIERLGEVEILGFFPGRI